MLLTGNFLSIFYKTVGEGDDAYFIPSMAGYAAIVLFLIILLLVISFVSGEKKFNAKQLVFAAMSLALASVFSMIKLIHMPMGGSITLFSMLFVTLVGYWYGIKAGVVAAIAYGFIQLMMGPYIIHPLQMCVDYIFAFGALGLSGIFSGKKYGLVVGYWIAILGRLAFSFLSGMIFFGSASADYNMLPAVYSLLYNGGYIVGEGILTTILLVIPPVKKGIDKIGKMK